jgi:hypothetical protein
MKLNYLVNSTKEYHVNQLSTLGWELTVCNALYPPGTPLRDLCSGRDSYGHNLYHFLSSVIPLEKIRKVIEIGGGYGYLMRDFLDLDPLLEVSMIDVSPVLLEKQREVLKGFKVSCRKEDFLEMETTRLDGFDLAIMNENLGDFPTLVNVGTGALDGSFGSDDENLKGARLLFEKYSFGRPDGETFNLNIGAIAAIEKLCSANIPYIFLGEHSCETSAPAWLRSSGRPVALGNPERISLSGHDEYSIKFSYLQQVAQAYGYTCLRGPFADIVDLELTPELEFLVSPAGAYREEGELVRFFVEDLFKYEYLVLTGKDSGERTCR